MIARQRQTLKRDLVATTWNANGVADKHSELIEFVARHKPGVLLLGEIQLTLSRRFRLTNYVFHRDDRISRVGGGTAIAVKAIRHCLVNVFTLPHSNFFPLSRPRGNTA